MFSQFQTFDDEGDWLIALQQYSLHGGLYNHTYSQCGPFYYEFWSAVCKIFGISFSLDNGRFLTMGAWLTASLLFAIGAWIWTGRIAIALVVDVVTFLLLLSLIYEPMEPAGLSYVLLALVVIGLGLINRGVQRVGFGLVGASAAALLLTKINIGVLAMVGLGAAVLICWPGSRRNVARKILGLLVTLTAGVALLDPVLSESWVQRLLAFFVFTVFGVGIHLLTRTDTSSDLYPSGAGVGAVAAVSTGATVCLIVLLNGTTLPQLISGAFLSQRNLPHIFQFAPPLSISWVIFSLACAVSGLVVAVVCRRQRTGAWLTTRLAGAVRLGIGAWMLWSMIPLTVLDAPGNGKSFLWAAPLAWVALLPTHRAPYRGPDFPRVALVLIGVIECLETFPVAGSQYQWASVALAPVAALCLWDGVALLSSGDSDVIARSSQFAISNRLGLNVGRTVVAMLLFVIVWTPADTFGTNRINYDRYVALTSPGAHLIHLYSSLQKQMDAVTAFLKKNCLTFESFPGLNSFYFLSGEAPPTGLNTTQWMNLLSLHQQGEILAKLQNTPKLCVVEDLALLPFWDQGRPLKRTPLVKYIESNFRVVQREGDYSLLEPKLAAASKLSEPPTAVPSTSL
jgi:hypothetical protein